jgi:hypothetical protein
MLVILATQEAQIRRIKVQIVYETPSQKNPSQILKRLVE